MSDGQFIGDLTKLLERRKIKCGDPLSLETFPSELSSNNILRSDLFTLCTAISHMAEEDLSGEELLVLVGRAVGGAQVCRGDGSVEIPDGMRSAFLSGFEAWGKRGELSEPLPWPPPRPQLARSEPVPPAEESKSASEEGGAKAPVAGLHTLQEALEIAKGRSPTGVVQQRSSGNGPNVDGLTISELKTLLEDIEHRMSRIQPHLSQLNSMVDFSAGDFRRQKRAGEPEDVIPFRAAPSAETATAAALRSSASLAGSLAAIAGRDTAPAWKSPVADVGEDAFLARHPYLKASKRTVPDLAIFMLPLTPIDVIPVVEPVPAPAAVPAASVGPSVPVAAALQAVPIVVPPGAPIPALAAVPVERVSAPAVVSQAVAGPPPSVVAPGVAQPHVMGLNPIGAALVYVLDGLRANPQLVFAMVGILLLVPTAFAGAFVYSYLHPKTVIRYPDPLPAAVAQTPDVPADALAGGVQDAAGGATLNVRPAGSAARVTAKPQPAIAYSAASRVDETRLARPISRPQSQASVWPPPPESAETAAPARPLVAAATATLPTASARRPSHLTGPPASSIYVPSSTMIKYAVSTPRPAYPQNQAKGIDGTVVVQITVSKQGDVTSARAVSGPLEIRSAAVQAVRMWRFRPYLFSGSPADVETMLEIPFNPQ